MNKIVHPIIIFFSLSGATLAAAFIVLASWQAAGAEINLVTNKIKDLSYSTSTLSIKKAKTPKQVVKGLYLTAYSAGSPKKVDQIIDLINKTELNAVVIDIKDYSGYVLYDSKLPLVNKLKLKDNRYPDLAATVKKFHDNKIYVIARQTVFQDPILAEKNPEWAIKRKSGGLWRDHKGLAWVDPTKKEVWNYNIAIAKEVTEYGFDELNFDYVRFPSDGDIRQVVYSVPVAKKYEVMGEFYGYLSNRLAEMPVWISLDLFGFVMEKKGEDDMNIGQRLADSVNAVDYIYPMMYPSHYPSGHLGLKNPAASPGVVIENGMEKGMVQFENAKAEVRPWLQAFDMGAVYNGQMIRAQIDMVEKYASSGWLLWNASNRYSEAGLKPD